MSYIENNLVPGEEILYKGKISPFSCINLWIIVGILLLLIGFGNQNSSIIGIGFVIIVGWIIYLITTILTTEFAMTNKRLIGKGGFIKRYSFEQHLDRIDSVEIAQSIIGRIFNFGYIGYNTAGAKNGINGIAKPMDLKNKINNYIFENFKK